MIISRLNRVFNLTNIIFFEGRLVERLYNTKNKYLVILGYYDYDYIRIPAIRKRLDRVFKREGRP